MPVHRLSSRPLLGTRADAALFTGRADELRRGRRALNDRLNCIFVGDPGAGRTSVLHQLLAETSAPQVLIRGNSAADGAELLDRISDELRLAGFADPAPAGSAGGPIPQPGPLELIEAARRQADCVDGLLIAVDDVAPDAGLDLFGRHRDELWAIDACWVATVSTGHAASLLRPPADVFFEVRIDLDPLTDVESIALLRKRLSAGLIAAADNAATDNADSTIDHHWLARIVGAGGGNPRRLIELARLLDEADIATVMAKTDAAHLRDAVIARASAPARMLAKELESLGGASASDDALLDRLGWTRPRAVQVLKELETAGVVVAVDQRTGRGRPRKVYRLVGDG